MSKKENKQVEEEVEVADNKKAEKNTEEQTNKEESNKKEETVEQSAEEKLQEELQEEKNKFLRLFAEFENYKKRTSKERIELFSTASQDVMVAMLPIIDDFERALNHMEEAEELKKGVDLIYQKLMNTLGQKGLKVIEVNNGDAFNADDHEAVTQIPAPSDDLKGKIIDVVEKGYKLGEKVIRFPKVVIGQ